MRDENAVKMGKRREGLVNRERVESGAKDK